MTFGSGRNLAVETAADQGQGFPQTGIPWQAWRVGQDRQAWIVQAQGVVHLAPDGWVLLIIKVKPRLREIVAK
ncbi:hypothetical protein [Vulcanococcus limneticus]|uniref:hypothetical protein n=1 Tax=Vulcanococcus limneticus TaxID=2170428 RepID=UPI00398C1C3B